MSGEAVVDYEQELAYEIAGYEHDPLGFVKFAYPWGEGDLRESSGPRKWQADILAQLGDHLASPDTRHVPFLLSVASGHGIGKSALVAFIIHWALSTCVDCRIVTTANTGDQLNTKTVPETTKWFNRGINKHWWKLGTEAIKVRDPEHEKNWRADFLTWSLERTEAFAGLHNERKRIVLIFDEASAIPDRIWEVAEGALTDEETEIIWLAFGNPTLNTGRFRECFGKLKHRWQPKQIDSRNVEGTNKAQIQQWIEDYGEDSDFCRVRVRGEFPRSGSNQFISSEHCAAARKAKAEGYETLPRVLSADVARFGDDQSVIGDRQGRKARILKKFRGLSTTEFAQRIMEVIDEAEKNGQPYDGLVIDGDGLGAGTVDYIRHCRYDQKVPLFEFHGGEKANDTDKYYNRRAEIWGLMREWLPTGDIPDDAELETDLTGPQYGFSAKQQIQLERKEDMKARGLASPDTADMLAMTFAVSILPKPKPAPPPVYDMRTRAQAWMG